MRKILLMVFCVIVLTAGTFAQKIHWLLFVDTKDANVGQLDVNGREYLRANFVDIVNSALKGVYQPEIYDMYDNNCTAFKCKSTIESLRCSSDDIVIFYYIGHGGRSTLVDPNDHPWPKMWFYQGGDYRPDLMLDLSWVHEQLKAKNPRLLLTIGMCCNKEQGDIPPDIMPTFSQRSYGSVYVSPEQIENIKEAFTKTCGNLIATSSKPGQVSRAPKRYPDDWGIKPMDFYTVAMCMNFRLMVEEQEVDLNNLFKNTENTVIGWLDNIQTPFSYSQLRQGQCTTPRTNGNCRPMLSSININNITDLENMMEAVVCNKEDMPNRSNYFDNNCVVRIIGQDGRTQVDRVSINTYMLRARTSDALLRIVPVGTMVDNGKIKELYVKEYYKGRR